MSHCVRKTPKMVVGEFILLFLFHAQVDLAFILSVSTSPRCQYSPLGLTDIFLVALALLWLILCWADPQVVLMSGQGLFWLQLRGS